MGLKQSFGGDAMTSAVYRSDGTEDRKKCQQLILKLDQNAASQMLRKELNYSRSVLKSNYTASCEKVTGQKKKHSTSIN